MNSNPARALLLPSDMNIWPLFSCEKRNMYAIGSISQDKYIVVPSTHKDITSKIFALYRQGLNPAEIEDKLKTDGINANVCDFFVMLAQKGFLFDGTNDATRDSGRRFSSNTHVFFDLMNKLSFVLFSVDLTPLKSLLRRVKIDIAPWLFLSSLSSFVFAMFMASGNWAKISQVIFERTTLQSGFYSVLLNFGAIPICIALHEAGHALVASKHDVFPARMSLRVYFLAMPYVAMQVSGLYTLPYGRRLLTYLAGPATDLLIGSSALSLAFVLSNSDVALFFLLLAAATLSRFLFNLIPLFPFSDGMKALSEGVFTELDIRGESIRQFWRWREHMPNSFVTVRYLSFFLFNFLTSFTLLAALFIWLFSGANRVLASIITFADLPMPAISSWFGLVPCLVAAFLIRKKIFSFLIGNPNPKYDANGGTAI